MCLALGIGPDQPVHPHSLIRAFVFLLQNPPLVGHFVSSPREREKRDRRE